MKTFRGRFQVLAMAGLCATLAGGAARAEEPKAASTPEIAARCTDFLNKVNALQRKELDRRMTAEIADVAKIAGLGPDGIKSLQAAAATAEDAAQADLLAKAVEMYKKVYARAGARGLDDLGQPGVIALAARPDSGFDAQVPYIRAVDQPAWKDAVAHVLTPEQAKVLQKSQLARNGVVSKGFEDLLDQQADQVRASISGPILLERNKIIDTLDLAVVRAEEINALAKNAVDASMDAWRRDARKQYLSNEDSARIKFGRPRAMYFSTREDDKPENQAVWKDGLARLLSADDRAKLESSQGVQRKRRTHALAMLMLTLMDDKVAFTSSQRPKLEPVMERLVQTVSEFYPQHDRNSEYYNLNLASFYKAAAAAKPEELRSILDDLQRKRWQDTSRKKNPTNDEEEEDSQPAPSPAATAAAIEEPEDLEQIVSNYLATKSATQRRIYDTAMLLQAEDAARVAALPPATAERLRTAAHGAAEAALANWSSSAEQTIRGQVQGATREILQQRLSNNNRYYFERSSPKDQTVWKTAVKRDLTQAQQDVWRTECDARAQYSDEAIAQFVLAEFDRSFGLTGDQWDRLAVLLPKTIHDYRPDLGQMFSYNSPQWFLTSYCMFLPFHVLPEEEFKTIIGQDRQERWAGSSGYRYSMQYVNNLKQYHAQRTKEANK